MLNNFFHQLSHRFKNENDLSDITWALCESSPDFKKMFLSFFFTELGYESNEVISKIHLQREKTEDRSRPDFYFENEGIKYIIEVKIKDTDDHFDKYKTNFSTARFGWIANYKMEKRNDIVIKTWEEFYDFINIKPNESREVIVAYTHYLKKLCSIIKLKKMTLDHSPFNFLRMIKNVIEKERNNFSASLYWSNKDGHNYLTTDRDLVNMRIGLYFRINKKVENSKIIYPWLGMYIQENETSIWMEFKSYEGWCKEVYEKIDLDKTISAIYSQPPEKYDDFDPVVGFRLKTEWLIKLNAAPTICEQEEILDNFYMEVVKAVSNYF